MGKSRGVTTCLKSTKKYKWFKVLDISSLNALNYLYLPNRLVMPFHVYESDENNIDEPKEQTNFSGKINHLCVPIFLYTIF